MTGLSAKTKATMNKKNTQYLFTTYAHLFNPDPKMQNNLMIFGFECGDGWFTLINELCYQLNAHRQWCEACINDYNNKKSWTFNWPEERLVKYKHATTIQVVQVKEKFGTLRFYIRGGNDFMDGAIDLAEELSAFICETCGAPGENKEINGWWTTMCRACLRSDWRAKTALMTWGQKLGYLWRTKTMVIRYRWWSIKNQWKNTNIK